MQHEYNNGSSANQRTESVNDEEEEKYSSNFEAFEDGSEEEQHA